MSQVRKELPSRSDALLGDPQVDQQPFPAPSTGKRNEGCFPKRKGTSGITFFWGGEGIAFKKPPPSIPRRGSVRVCVV